MQGLDSNGRLRVRDADVGVPSGQRQLTGRDVQLQPPLLVVASSAERPVRVWLVLEQLAGDEGKCLLYRGAVQRRQRGVEQPVELREVHPPACCVEPVAAVVGHDHRSPPGTVAREPPPQHRDVVLQRPGSVLRQRVAPQQVGELVLRHVPSAAECEDLEQLLGFAAAEVLRRQAAPVDGNVHRAEDAYFRGHEPPRNRAAVRREISTYSSLALSPDRTIGHRAQVCGGRPGH